ncbi:MAG: DUF1572 family protein [Gemmatimonadales bacterium]
MTPTDPAAEFLRQSREYLTGHYLPKIQAALERVEDPDLWWRPNPASNSLGNLLLHLAGNLRQWVVSGMGGAPDCRDRAAEFATLEGLTRAELLATLTEAVLDADAVLARTDPGSLGERRQIQGRAVTVFEAIYHAVEHFAMHTGQIIYLVKLRTREDLGFYRMEDGIVRPAWPGHPTEGSA